MKQLSYRIYVELDDGDSIAIDEIMSNIRADYSTLEKAKAAIKKNAEKIRVFDDDTVTIVGISIVEVLYTDDDIESEVIENYSAAELANMI